MLHSKTFPLLLIYNRPRVKRTRFLQTMEIQFTSEQHLNLSTTVRQTPLNTSEWKILFTYSLKNINKCRHIDSKRIPSFKQMFDENALYKVQSVSENRCVTATSEFPVQQTNFQEINVYIQPHCITCWVSSNSIDQKIRIRKQERCANVHDHL